MSAPAQGNRARHKGAVERWQILALLVIIALGIGLRFYRLNAQSLWNDEGTSVALAQRDLATISRNASQDIHPPLYYYLLHGWMRLWGSSESAVRGLSALVGSLVVVLTYTLTLRLGRTMPGGPASALVAALFVALSPFHIYYAQEARMYMLVTFFGLLSMLAFVSLAQQLKGTDVLAGGGPRAPARHMLWRAGLYVLATVSAVYSHYFAFALILAQNIAFLLWLLRPSTRSLSGRRGAIRFALAWAALQAVILLAYLPWLALSWRSLASWPSVSAPLSLPSLLAAVARVFALGVTVPEGKLSTTIGLALSALAMLPLVWLVRRQRNGEREDGWGLEVILLYALVPVAMMYVLSLSRPMYKPKFLLLATPAYHILQAWGACSLAPLLKRTRRARGWGIGLALMVILAVGAASGRSLANLYTGPAYYRDDYRGIVAYIQATAGPTDAIIINAPSQIETVDYYYRGTWPQYPLPRQRPIDIGETEKELEGIVSRHARLYAIFWATDESDPDSIIENWLDRNCFKAMDSWFGNLRLVMYAVPQAPTNEIQHEAPADLGEVIRFHGYSLQSETPQAGAILQVTLYWEARAQIAQRYKVFAHLVDGRGNIVGQRDGEPVGGSRPTTTWQRGELIPDNYGIAVPPGTLPGEHVLRIGMYDAGTGQRLSVAAIGATGVPATALDLARLTIARSEVPPPIEALDRQSRDDTSWGGVTLVGHSLYRLGAEHQGTVTWVAGDVAKMILYWRIDDPSEAGRESASQPFAVSLVDHAGQRVWQRVLSSYGSAAWRSGDLIRDIHQLHLPRDLRPGRYHLDLAPVGDSESLQLERITVR